MNARTLLLLAGLLTSLGNGPPVWADKLGQLFTTPQQRAMLNATLRSNSQQSTRQGRTGKIAVAARRLKLNGTLLGSNGKHRIWINGNLVKGQTAVGGARVRILDSDHVRLRLPVSGKSRIVSPGQVVNIASGRVTEAYLQKALPVTTQDSGSRERHE